MRQSCLLLAILSLFSCYNNPMNWNDQVRVPELNTRFATTHIVQHTDRLYIEGDVECFDGGTPLHHAAVLGELPLVASLLSGNVAANTPNKAGRTALHAAAKNNYIDIVRLLLKHKADPNIQDIVRKQTALHAAAQNGSKEVFAELLRHGADVMLQDSQCYTGFSAAVAFSNIDAICAIIEQAPLQTITYDDEVNDSYNRMVALLRSLKRAHITLPKNILAHIVSFMPDAVTNPNVTHLIESYASRERKRFVRVALRIRQLLPLFLTKTKYGMPPWQLAKKRGYEKLSQVLMPDELYTFWFQYLYYYEQDKE